MRCTLLGSKASSISRVAPPSSAIQCVRIRHYGLFAARNVHTKLAAARHLLDPELAELAQTAALPAETRPWWEQFREHTGIDLMACPSCANGRLVRRQALAPNEIEIAGLADARASPVAA